MQSYEQGYQAGRLYAAINKTAPIGRSYIETLRALPLYLVERDAEYIHGAVTGVMSI